MDTHHEHPHPAATPALPQRPVVLAKPAEDARTVLASASTLSVDHERLEAVVHLIAQEKLELPRWNFSPQYPVSGSTEELARYFLLLNAINYCFFHSAQSEFGGARYSDGKLSGAELCAARLTAHRQLYETPAQLLTMTAAEYEEVFAASTPIPLLTERIRHLREVGRFLNELSERGDTLCSWLGSLGGDAGTIAATLPEVVPGFSDRFLKRSQLFIGMLYGRIRDHEDSPLDPRSLSKLTVFADYRVPQALIGLGIIVPGEELERVLTSRTEIAEGSSMEVELRAATIVGGELLAERLAQLRKEEITALHIDYLLWKAPRDFEKGRAQSNLFLRSLPEHHRCITTLY